MTTRTLLFGLILFLLMAHMPVSISAQDGRTGYINHTGIDLLAGRSENSIRLQMTHGYQITERFSAGIGAGYVFYSDPLDLVPVYIDFIYQLSGGKVAPFLQFKLGSSISILRDHNSEPDRHKGGAMLNPALGLQITNGTGSGIYFSAGFNLDNSAIEQDAFGGRIIKEAISYRSISLGFGLILR